MVDTRLRARIAAAVLLAAPCMLVAVAGFDLVSADGWRIGAEWVGFGSWIPAVLCLEHFLKKVADRLAALANGLGLVGSWLGASAAAGEWGGSAVGADPVSWLLEVKLAASLVLACAWLLFAWGHGKHRLVPSGVAAGVAAAAIGWAAGRAFGVPILELLASGCLALSMGWMGAQLWARPERWNQPFVGAPPRRPSADLVSPDQ